MNFMRKKPSSPIDDLTELYNDTANRTIQNIALEQKGDYKSAVQGWKGLHTNVLYKMDVIGKSFSNAAYSADELYLREGIEELDAKGLDHFDRVYKLYLESEQSERESSKLPYSSPYNVPTLRGQSPQGFAVRQQAQEQQRQPRLLKTLRADKPHKVSANLHSKPSEVSKMAANIMYNNNHQQQQPASSLSKQNWTTSKSLTPSISNFRTSDEIDIFDQSFEDDVDFDVQSQRRNETLLQLEAVGHQSKASRSRTQERDEISSQFENLQVNDSSPRKSLSQSPVRRSPNIQDSSDSSLDLSSRPPIPKTSTLLSTSPKKQSLLKPTAKKSLPATLSNNKAASTSRLPSRNPSTPAVKSTSSLSSVKPPIRSTSSTRTLPTYKTVPVKKLVKPAAPTNTVRPPLKKPTAKPTVKQAPIKRAQPQKKSTAGRSRSSSPIRGETKDTETINSESSDGTPDEMELSEKEVRAKMEDQIIESIRGIDYVAAKQIFNEIVVRGDEVRWDDIAGLETAKTSLKETVVYPFLRPDLFSGLREPARGMLLFGPPGTGKTMLARAVATESNSTFFSISASSLTSKFLGESEKLVRALFLLAKKLSPSIIFVDEIDSLLSARNESGEHESSRRIKNEFLIQWSDLTHAAAGRDQGEDLQRVLVLAATNLPWAIDEAARRRFVRRQYIPLPEADTRLAHISKLLEHQKHTLDEKDQLRLVELTEGYSGSDITALAKDAAMGPLRSLGDKLLSTARDEIRPIELKDFENSLVFIKPSVSKENLIQFDDWAAKFGSSGV